MKVVKVSQKIINVCVGILTNSLTQEVFMASRPLDKIMPGYWEFPGGKIEANESIYEALSRELNEELNINVALEDMQLIGNVEHSYPHGLAKLSLINVTKWNGAIIANEGQNIHWQNLDSIVEIQPLLPTTAEILNLLRQQRNLS